MAREMKPIIYAIYDLLASVVIFLLLPILKITRKYGVENFPLQYKLFQWWGVFPIRDHYYETKFVYESSFEAGRVRDLPIAIDLDGQLQQLHNFVYITELAFLPAEKLEEGKFFVHNPNFAAGDAELYY